MFKSLIRLRCLHWGGAGRVDPLRAGHCLGDQPNFQGRSGPGRLYLASPLTVATSATGRISAWSEDVFAG